MKRSLLVLALAALAAQANAQQQNTDFQIVSITPDLVTTPEYSINYGPKNKRVAKNKDFVELEVTFDWQPKDNFCENRQQQIGDPKIFKDLLRKSYFDFSQQKIICIFFVKININVINKIKNNIYK